MNKSMGIELLTLAGAFATTTAVDLTTDLPWWGSVMIGAVVPLAMMAFKLTIMLLHHYGKISDKTYEFLGGIIQDYQDDGKLNGSNKKPADEGTKTDESKEDKTK